MNVAKSLVDNKCPLLPGPHWTVLKQSEIKVWSFWIVEGEYVAYVRRIEPTNNTAAKPVYA